MADPIKDPLREWIELVTQLKVIHANDPEPSAPRPSVDDSVETYIAIELNEDESIYSTPYEREQLAEGRGTERKRQQLREGTISIEIFGPGAQDYGRALDISRGRQDVIDLLKAAGDISIGTVSEVSDAPRIMSIEREPDVSLSASVSWVQTETITNTNYAASAESDATVEDPS